MGTPLRVIDHPGDDYRFNLHPPIGTGCVEVGDMWREPRSYCGGREAWVAVLPGGHVFWTTMGMDQGKGWDVIGCHRFITVSPSIQTYGEGAWHGWIRDGELVDA